MPVKKSGMRIKVFLNGTSVNPYHALGFTRNPFPQLGRAEYDAAERQISLLGADPIPPVGAEDYIRKTLAGFTSEFIELCVRNYKPGELAVFEVEFPE